MKRFLIPLLSLLLLLMPFPASAATEGDVYAALRDIGVPEAYVGQAAGMLAQGTSDGAGVYRSDGTYYPYSAMVTYIYANQDAILSYCGVQTDNGYVPGDPKNGTTAAKNGTTTAKNGTTTAKSGTTTVKTNGSGQQQTDAAGQSSRTDTSSTAADGDSAAEDASATESDSTAEGETTVTELTTGSETETTGTETTPETETTDTETETAGEETTTEETEISDETVKAEKQHRHGFIIAGVLLAAALGGVVLMLRGMMPEKNKKSERD